LLSGCVLRGPKIRNGLDFSIVCATWLDLDYCRFTRWGIEAIPLRTVSLAVFLKSHLIQISAQAGSLGDIQQPDSVRRDIGDMEQKPVGTIGLGFEDGSEWFIRRPGSAWGSEQQQQEDMDQLHGMAGLMGLDPRTWSELSEYCKKNVKEKAFIYSEAKAICSFFASSPEE
jgi:hypothetical protein